MDLEVITRRFTAIPSELVSAKAWIGKVKGKALDEMDEHDLAFKASILNTQGCLRFSPE